MLLYWEMVRFAVSAGLTTFDFGRSTPGDGTFLFKQQWGAPAAPARLGILDAPTACALPDRNRENPKFAAAIAAWQRLPVSVATALGPRHFAEPSLIMILLLSLSLGALAYIYVGYPLLLQLIVWLAAPELVRIGADHSDRQRGDLRLQRGGGDPPQDREHAGAGLPAGPPPGGGDLRRSDDGTDDIVREFADARRVIKRQEERLGKTAGLNRTVPQLTSEIVVFSDANAMYEPDALEMLVRNFADPPSAASRVKRGT